MSAKGAFRYMLRATLAQALVADGLAADMSLVKTGPAVLAWAEKTADDLAAMLGPIPMVLHCPACGLQHIDAPEPPNGDDMPDAPIEGLTAPEDWAERERQYDEWKKGWTNPPHRSHLCHGRDGCGHIWRPADVPTTGVAAVATRGQNDTPPPETPKGWTMRPVPDYLAARVGIFILENSK